MAGSIPVRHRRAGFALLATLWMTVVIAACALTALAAARDAQATAANRTALSAARWTAQGCAERVRAVVDAALVEEATRSGTVPVESDVWSDLDSVIQVALGIPAESRACAVDALPVGTRIDVNAASGELLLRAALSAGLDSTRAFEIASAILDWRDVDDEARPSGSERAWYVAAQRTPPRNGSFRSEGELGLVRGLEAPEHGPVPPTSLLRELVDVEPGRVVIGRAPVAVLRALPGFTPRLADAVHAARARGRTVRTAQDVAALAATESSEVEHALMDRFAAFGEVTTATPDAWLLRFRVAARGPSRLQSSLELRMVRAGPRAVVVGRREAP